MLDEDSGEQCWHAQQKDDKVTGIVRLGALESHMRKLGNGNDKDRVPV